MRSSLPSTRCLFFQLIKQLRRLWLSLTSAEKSVTFNKTSVSSVYNRDVLHALSRTKVWPESNFGDGPAKTWARVRESANLASRESAARASPIAGGGLKKKERIHEIVAERTRRKMT